MAMYCSLCSSVHTSAEFRDYRCEFCKNGIILADFSSSTSDEASSNDGPQMHQSTTALEKWIFRCAFCDQDYMNREGLWNHLSVHEITDNQRELHCNETNVRYDPHECAICNDKRCYREDQLKAHIHTAHDGFSVQCSFCGQFFHTVERKVKHTLYCKAACNSRSVDVNSIASAMSVYVNILPTSTAETAEFNDRQVPNMRQSKKTPPEEPTVADDRGVQQYITSFEKFCQNRIQVFSARKTQYEEIIDNVESNRIHWTKVITSIVTGNMSFTEASVHYNVPRATLYERILGTFDRNAILQEIPLNAEDVYAILDFCTVFPPGRARQKAVVQPLEKIWEFMKGFPGFRGQVSQYRFGEVLFFRWWWAFCRHHNVDVCPPKRMIGGDSETSKRGISNVDVGAVADLQEAISDVVTGRLNFVEASSLYGIPKSTLLHRSIEWTNPTASLEKIPLSPEEEALILKFCVKNYRANAKNKELTQPLQKIWEFMNRFGDFQDKAEEFRFGGRTFFRWWWAFCTKHNVDTWSPRLVTREDSEIYKMEGALVEWKEAVYDIVTGQRGILEASNHYNIPMRPLYSRTLGQTDRMAVLQEITLSTEEEDQILRFCTISRTHGTTTKKVLTQPLVRIWEFMNCFQNFRAKADQFQFGGIAFFRWWWAFCLKHKVDVRPPKEKPN